MSVSGLNYDRRLFKVIDAGPPSTTRIRSGCTAASGRSGTALSR